MDINKLALERAFEIAASGVCNNVSDVQVKLKSEGYSSIQLQGPSLFKQIRQIIKNAKTEV